MLSYVFACLSIGPKDDNNNLNAVVSPRMYHYSSLINTITNRICQQNTPYTT
jgi:hypothetical protein